MHYPIKNTNIIVWTLAYNKFMLSKTYVDMWLHIMKYIVLYLRMQIKMSRKSIEQKYFEKSSWETKFHPR